MDVLDIYSMGSGIAQFFLGFVFFMKFLNRKIKPCFYLLSAVCGGIFVYVIRGGGAMQLTAYVLVLVAGGLLIPSDKSREKRLRAQGETGWRSVLLSAVLVAEALQLCYGIMKSLWSLLFPLTAALDGRIAGYLFMVSGELASLLLFWLCCHMIYRYFPGRETVRQQYLLMVLIPVLMIFLMEVYINFIIYGVGVTDDSAVTVYNNHYQMFAIQLLGIGSLFCILAAYQKALQSIRLATEVSLLEQQERSLNQYVEEARTRYEKTASFRHDVRNHIAVVQKLLQSGNWEQAVQYMGDMEEMAQDLSIPVSTNNPVADILVGNKLGIARSMGIAADCSLLLPYPCGLRDIDICIILSNGLDNAVHACNEMEDGEKYIRVAGHMQGDFLLIEIENSFQGTGMPKEGTGLSNIRAVAEKYQGAVSVKIQGNVFLLHVLMIIPQYVDP